jgi:hypothetical protein
VDKEIFLARWTASPEIDSSTQLVFTFPGGFQPVDPVGGPDPVSVWAWDEEERFNFSPRSIVLPWEVTRCTLENGLNSASGNTELLCDGNAGPLEIVGSGGTFTGGWLRIINNNALADVDAIGDDTGVESDGLDAPPDSRFPALALAFSFAEGVDGMFDQSYPVQWAAVLGAGGLGGPSCNRTRSGFPSGCLSYNIPSTFSPWRTPQGVFCTFEGGIPIPEENPISDILLDLVPGLAEGLNPTLGSNLCLPGDNVSAAEERTGTADP